MEDTQKKRRGRPLKDTADDDSALGQRRARVRQAQREFRRRKEDTLSTQAKKIIVLGSALESMSNTFLELTDAMLRAEEVQASRRLVHEIQNATQRVLDTARDIGEEGEEGAGADEEPYEKHEAEDWEPVFGDSVRFESHQYPRDLPIRPPSPLPPQQNSSHAWPPPFEEDATQPQLSPVGLLPHRIPTFTSAFLSREFWTADYTTYTTFPSPSLPTHLPFPQRLLRISITTSYHALRGDPAYSTHFTKAQFRFSIPVRPVGFILASARRVLTQAEWWDTNPSLGPQVPTKRFFENEPARAFGRDAKAEMLRVGERVEDWVDAEGVAAYLDGKGRFYDDGSVMMLKIRVPAPTSLRERGAKMNVKATKKTVLKLDVNGLIERLTWAAVCMGDMVGYPKAKLNAAIVASAITMAG